MSIVFDLKELKLLTELVMSFYDFYSSSHYNIKLEFGESAKSLQRLDIDKNFTDILLPEDIQNFPKLQKLSLECV